MYEQVQSKLDASENFMQEMPLALKLEQFQRRKLLEGLKPMRDAAQKDSLVQLQSLKYVQKFSGETNEVTAELRSRQYKEYSVDPLGKHRRAELESLKNKKYTDPFFDNIKFI